MHGDGPRYVTKEGKRVNEGCYVAEGGLIVVSVSCKR